MLATMAFAAGGLRRSNRGNAALVGVALVGLLAFVASPTLLIYRVGGFANFLTPNPWPARGIDGTAFARAAALMFVAFAGYGRLATLGEEVIDPRRNVPRAILVCLGVTTALYLHVAFTVNTFSGLTWSLAASGDRAPLAVMAARFGPAPVALVTAGACAALAGTLLNLLLGLSRVLLAMARRGEMPGGLAAVANDSPRRAVWAAGICVAAVAAVGGVKLTWSVAACAVLLYYGLTNAAALRLPPEDRRFPRGFAWAGLTGCASLAWFVTPAAAAVVAGWLAVGAVWRIGAVRARARRAERPAG